MKRIAICLLSVAVSLAVSCQQAPELALSSPSSIDVSENGGSSTISFTASGDWTAYSSDSWVTVSPSSGTVSADGAASVQVNCAANNTYEARSATVMITVEDLTQMVTVNQPANQGLFISDDTSYEMPFNGGEIQVNVQANVQFDVKSEVEWIHYVETKALSNSTVCLIVDENETYDMREGRILISQLNGSLSYDINVKQAGRVAIDLGLPSGLKWAECNIGASRPEEYGDYYAWGEIEKKDYYEWSNYKWCNGSHKTLTKYNTESSYGTEDNKTKLEASDDVANVKLGDGWHTPTDADWMELQTECTWVWTNLNSTNGIKVTSPNGNSIFLPASGFRSNENLFDADSDGYYWSSSLYTGSPRYGLGVYFNSGTLLRTNHSRELGMSIRPVVHSNVVSVSNVSLNPTSLTMNEGETNSLVAAVKPDNATDKSVTWSSSNTSVAKVSSSGVVTAMKAGCSTISVKTFDGNKTATCEVTVSALSEPDAIDLGLPSGLKWASFNIGASTPEDYGDYYAWGETELKPEYSATNYKWYNDTFGTLIKYNTQSSYGTVDNKTVLEANDDVAHARLGGKWRMPTDAEWTELLAECTWIWESLNEVNGYKVIGPNGNSIFLPAAGSWFDPNLNYAGSFGNYWTSSLDMDFPRSAWDVCFYSGDVYRSGGLRSYGQSVRPVSLP